MFGACSEPLYLMNGLLGYNALFKKYWIPVCIYTIFFILIGVKK